MLLLVGAQPCARHDITKDYNAEEGRVGCALLGDTAASQFLMRLCVGLREPVQHTPRIDNGVPVHAGPVEVEELLVVN